MSVWIHSCCSDLPPEFSGCNVNELTSAKVHCNYSKVAVPLEMAAGMWDRPTTQSVGAHCLMVIGVCVVHVSITMTACMDA